MNKTRSNINKLKMISFIFIFMLAIFSRTVEAAGCSISEHEYNGIKFEFVNNNNGEITLKINNTTDYDIYNIKLENPIISGLKLSDKELLIQKVNAGKTENMTFEYSKELTNIGKTDNIEKDKTETDKPVKAISENMNESVNPNTGDNHSISLFILLLFISIFILALISKNKKSNLKNILGLFALLLLGSITFFTGSNILNAENGVMLNNGRLKFQTHISGKICIGNDSYDYSGNLTYEKDNIVEEEIQEKIPYGAKITLDSEMEVGKYKIVNNNVKDGYKNIKVTYINGKETNRELFGEKIAPIDYEIVVGSKEIIKETEVNFSTEYVANKEEYVGYKNTLESGKNGKSIEYLSIVDSEKFEDFKKDVLSGKIARQGTSEKLILSKTEVKKPIPEIIELGTKDKEERVIQKTIKYISDSDKDINSKAEIIEEGKDGIEEIIFTQEVNRETGEIIPGKEILKTETIQEPIAKIVSVGAREIVEEKIPYDTIIEYDDNQWISFKNVIVAGEEGIDKVTYQYSVEEKTGALIDKKEIERVEVKKPITEKTVVGSKTHEWIEKNIEEIVKSYDIEYIPYIADVTEINTIDKFNNLNTRFDSLSQGKTFVTDKPGENGLERVIVEIAVKEDGTLNEDFEPRNKTVEMIKDPVTELRLFKNYVSEDISIPFKTEYVKSEVLNVGESNIFKSGKEGSKTNIRIYNDIKLSQKIDETNIINTHPINEIKEIGVIDNVIEIIKFNSEVVEDSTKWDNYKKITSSGINGEKTTVYTHDVNVDTGALENRTVKDVSNIEPVTEITTIGTKKPNYVDIRETSPVAPAPTVTKNFVSQERFNSLKTYEDFMTVQAEFDQAKAGKTYIEAEKTFVNVLPKDGEKGQVYNYATDPANGQKISSYERKLVENIDIKPIVGENVKMNASLGDTRVVPFTTQYVADPTLAFGEQKVVQTGVNGVEQQVILSDGQVKWVKGKDSALQTRIVHVGNQNVYDRVDKLTDKDVDITYYNYSWSDYKTVLAEGENGSSRVTETYEVNKETGALTSPTQSVEITKAKVNTKIEQGAINRMPNHSVNLSTEAREFVTLVNNERAKEGLTPLAPLSDGEFANAADYAALAGERNEQLGVWSHLGTPYDSVMAWNAITSTNQTAETLFKNLMNSKAHKNILMNPRAKTIVVGSYARTLGNTGSDLYLKRVYLIAGVR